MRRELNPYHPGSGVAPRVLAGRVSELEAFDALIARTKLQMPARPLVLSGLRGVGKTVLLNRLRGLADAHDWLTVQFEARPGPSGRDAARRSLVNGLVKSASGYRRPQLGEAARRMLSTVTSFSLGLGITGFNLGVEADPSRAGTGSLELDLQDVIEDVSLAIRREGRGLAIFIDEMQDVDDELLEALVSAQHFANQRELPFFVVGAGLPNLPARLAGARSYAERIFDYRVIGRLDDGAARESLEKPAQQMGGAFEPEALDRLLAETGRYPYFIQEFGNAVWTVAPSSPFTLADAEAAIEVGRARLDAGFFPSRWDRATPAERRYLAAMARDREGPSQTGVVAQRLRKSQGTLGPTRAALIDKGLVYSPEWGQIAFTVPGMADFINRREDQRPA